MSVKRMTAGRLASSGCTVQAYSPGSEGTAALELRCCQNCWQCSAELVAAAWCKGTWAERKTTKLSDCPKSVVERNQRIQMSSNHKSQSGWAVRCSALVSRRLMSIWWWLSSSALSARDTMWKSLCCLLSLNSLKLLKCDATLGDTINRKSVVGGIGESAEIVSNKPVRRVVGAICAGRPRCGKTLAHWALPMFEELVYQSDIYEDDLRVGVIKNAPELMRSIGDGCHSAKSARQYGFR